MKNGIKLCSLIPYGDMLNNSSDFNVNYYFNENIQAYTFYATRDIEIGEELFGIYGKYNKITFL
jgi:hypothetical protein